MKTGTSSRVRSTRCTVLCVTSVLAIAVAGGCQPPDKAAESDALGSSSATGPLMRITPIQPARKTLVRWTEQPGQIEAFEETPLYAKVAGYVEKMYVDIGDPIEGPRFDDKNEAVSEGQVLAELSVPELHDELQQKQAAIGQAEAEVQQAKAAVKVAKSSEASARAKVEEVEAVKEQTQADYEFAKSELDRMKKLADRGAVTREVAEEKEKQFRAASSLRNQTAARIASAKSMVIEKQALIEKSEADLEAARQRLLVAEADVARLKSLLTYTKIRAPYDGVVTTRNVHTGHLVQPGVGSGGKPLLVVAQTRVMRIFVDVPETDAPLMSLGSEAQVRIPSTPSEPRKGTIARTAWILDSSSRTLRTEIDLPNEDGKLRPGMYAYAKLKVAERKDALSLPKGAILTVEGQSYCYTIDDGKVVRAPLETGIRAGDDVEIVSGLSGNELVIGVNATAFREGQPVEVVQPKNPAP